MLARGPSGIDMRILRASERIATPWKNGGGTTSEVVVHPSGAGFDGFGWRVSTARVDNSGPFSVFAGIDRHLAMLEGQVLLKIAGRDAIALSAQAQPVSFPGDVPTEADVIGGPAKDLNVMTRRASFRATLERRALSGTITATAHTSLLFSLADTSVNGTLLQREDVAQFESGEAIAVAPATDAYWIEISAI